MKDAYQFILDNKATFVAIAWFIHWKVWPACCRAYPFLCENGGLNGIWNNILSGKQFPADDQSKTRPSVIADRPDGGSGDQPKK